MLRNTGRVTENVLSSLITQIYMISNFLPYWRCGDVVERGLRSLVIYKALAVGGAQEFRSTVARPVKEAPFHSFLTPWRPAGP